MKSRLIFLPQTVVAGPLLQQTANRTRRNSRAPRARHTSRRATLNFWCAKQRHGQQPRSEPGVSAKQCVRKLAIFAQHAPSTSAAKAAYSRTAVFTHLVHETMMMNTRLMMTLSECVAFVRCFMTCSPAQHAELKDLADHDEKLAAEPEPEQNGDMVICVPVFVCS